MLDLFIVLLRKILYANSLKVSEKSLVENLLEQFLQQRQTLTFKQASLEFMPILGLFLGKTAIFRSYLQAATVELASASLDLKMFDQQSIEFKEFV